MTAGGQAPPAPASLPSTVNAKPSFFVFSLPRSGSSMLDAIISQICAEIGIPVLKPTVHLFELGLEDMADASDFERNFNATGYCYSGFRGLPRFLSPHLLMGKKALMMVRDPRDILTSAYFASGFSHPPPGEGEWRTIYLEDRARIQTMSVDDFVLSELVGLERLFASMMAGLRTVELRLFRYEDVIDRKAEWLRDIACFLDLDVAPAILNEIAGRFEVRHDAERIEQHVRQVRPGDHRRKLRPETIVRLDGALSDHWQRLGYPFDEAQAELHMPAEIVATLGESPFGMAPPRPGTFAGASFFAFTLAPVGGSLLDAVMGELCVTSGVGVFQPWVQACALGLDIGAIDFDQESALPAVGYCFSGFRDFPPFLTAEFLAGKKVVMLIRDPCALLIATYLSLAFTHPVPEAEEARRQFLEMRASIGKMSVDDFVLSEVKVVEDYLSRLVTGLGMAKVRIYRYEDVIDRKQEWVRDLAAFVGIDLPTAVLDRIAWRYAGWKEDVPPDDPRCTLQPRTVRLLHRALSSRWLLLRHPFPGRQSRIALPNYIWRVLRRLPGPRC